MKAVVQWEAINPTSQEWLKGIRIIINHFKEVVQVWKIDFKKKNTIRFRF